jgi:hypothetical protein
MVFTRQRSSSKPTNTYARGPLRSDRGGPFDSGTLDGRGKPAPRDRKPRPLLKESTGSETQAIPTRARLGTRPGFFMPQPRPPP